MDPVTKDDNTAAIELLSDEQLNNLEKKSEPFVGKWNQLISTTNWEKGSIIIAWQTAMAKTDLPKSSYSDERWSQLCGGATPQHVGRLRRTSERFGHVFKEYSGLYWSHFYAALDWEDAEMWLEGAIQNNWSVSKMRDARWETMGQRPEDKPRVDQIVVSELDEESSSIRDTASINDREFVEGPRAEDPDFGDEPNPSSPQGRESSDSVSADVDETTKPEKLRPFESYVDLPEDVKKAANAFKVAIIRHKTDQWQDISLQDLHGLLDALKSLAIAAPE